MSTPTGDPRSAQTRRRILDAAADEFAERGLAGARVDRIAERAGANKQRLYAYFGSKDQLFDQVIEDRIGQLLDAVPFDATDLPAYAVRLFDFNRAHPELVRLLLWHALERPGVLAGLPQTAASNAAKVEALRSAGVPRPEALLGQLLALVQGYSLTVTSGVDAPDVDTVGADLHRAVALLRAAA